MSDSSGRADGTVRTAEEPPAHSQYAHGWTPSDDEISLFDIWDSLVRRKWLIAAVFLGINVFAAGYAMTRPDVYRYQVSVQIGHTSIETAKGTQREPIAGAVAVVARLKANLIPSALRKVFGLDEGHLPAGGNSIPNVQVDASADAGVVHLKIEGPDEKGKQYIETLRTAVNLLVRDHASVLQSERFRLTGLQARLSRKRERVATQVQQVNSRLERLVGIDGDNDAALALRVDGLQQRKGALQDRLLAIDANAEEVADHLATLDDISDVFAGDSPRSIDRQQQARNRLAGIGSGIRPSVMASVPERSPMKAATSGTLILALGSVLGAMAGVFSGFFAEFVSAARRRQQQALSPKALQPQSQVPAEERF